MNSATLCSSTDQRGTTRPTPICDAGAYQTPTIKSVTFGGSATAPTITIRGSGFVNRAALGAPQPTCGPPTTGFNYGNNFNLFDVTQDWAAGQGPPDACDFAGVIITSYSNTRIVFTFDSAYPTYGSLKAGDGYIMTVLGTAFSGTVKYPPQPVSLASLTPNQIAVGAKNLLTLDGSGFQAGAKIKVTGPSTGVKASQVTMVDATEMTAVITVPTGATVGTYTVTVTNPDLGKATCTNCLNVIAAPTLTAIDPASVALGTSKVPVTLTGTGFAPGARLRGPAGVTFNHIAVVNPTTITAKMTVSASATTGSNLPVSVTNDASAGNGKVTADILTLTSS